MKLPEYNELTQYIIEENGILVVKDITQTDTPMVEHTPQISEPYVPQPTESERIEQLESTQTKVIDCLADSLGVTI